MALATLLAANLFQVPCSATQADAYVSFYTSKAELVDRILGGADLYAMALAIREDNEFASNISKLVAESLEEELRKAKIELEALKAKS